jgi:hypothetical protein
MAGKVTKIVEMHEKMGNVVDKLICLADPEHSVPTGKFHIHWFDLLKRDIFA